MAALSFRNGPPTSDACPICIELLSDTQENGPALVHSGDGEKHPFHQRCIERLQPINGLAECPICRSRINIHSIMDLSRPFPLNYLAPPVRALRDRITSGLNSLHTYNPPCTVVVCTFALASLYAAASALVMYEHAYTQKQNPLT